MKSKHVILVELENSHDECLYSQVLFLEQSHHKVSMILSPHSFQSTQKFHYLCENVAQLEMKHGLFNHWKLTQKIMRFRRKWKSKVIIFNTAQGSFVRDFSLLTLWHRVRVLGVLHTIKKLQGSFTQKLISLKIKKYYLLSLILSNQLSPKKRRKVQVFYPIFFHHPILPKPFQKEKFNIIIPGGVETRRKDLKGFVDQFFNQPIPAHWNIIFAGKTEENNECFLRINNTIKLNNMNKQFVFYHGFIPQKEYFEIIEAGHVILPLIHPNTTSSDEYMSRQISGAFNLAYGFKTPMLIHKAYKKHEEFQCSSIFYNEEKLFDQIKSLDEDRNRLEEKRKAIQNYSLFDFEVQQNNFLSWVE